MQVIIDSVGGITYDMTKDFELECEDYVDIDIDYSLIQHYLENNPSKSVIDFGHDLVANVKEILNNGI